MKTVKYEIFIIRNLLSFTRPLGKRDEFIFEHTSPI